MFAVKAGASGDITPAPGATTSEGVLWSLPEGGPEFASPLLYEGYLYIFSRNRASVGCYDPTTGERLDGPDRLPGARAFWSSPWGYEGNIFCTDEAGTTFVFRAAPNFELLATNSLGEEVRSSPAIVDGAIILRGDNNVYFIKE